MMKHMIRSLQAEDLDSLMALIQEHADYERSSFNPSGKRERLENAIFLSKKLHCWVVESNGRVEGFVSFTFDYSTWDAADFIYMDCLYLREHLRGAGIGTEILQRLRLLALQKGCKNIQWQTPVFNESGIRFYEKNGAQSSRKVRFFLDAKSEA